MTPSGVSLACCESEHPSCAYAECECGCHVGPKPHTLELEIEGRVMEFDLDNPGEFRIYEKVR
jgi:hypothetical protein